MFVLLLMVGLLRPKSPGIPTNLVFIICVGCNMLNTYASTCQKTGHIRPHLPVCLDTVTLVCTHDRTTARTDRAHPDTVRRRCPAPPAYTGDQGARRHARREDAHTPSPSPSPPRAWTQAGGTSGCADPPGDGDGEDGGGGDPSSWIHLGARRRC